MGMENQISFLVVEHQKLDHFRFLAQLPYE